MGTLAHFQVVERVERSRHLLVDRMYEQIAGHDRGQAVRLTVGDEPHLFLVYLCQLYAHARMETGVGQALVDILRLILHMLDAANLTHLQRRERQTTSRGHVTLGGGDRVAVRVVGWMPHLL